MPSIALPVSLRGQLLSGVRSAVTVFSPADLFATGSQGIWLDPSDLSTMFSDRAGTTPVTTPGTVVGLRLDKSKGLALGAELDDGGLATLANWTVFGTNVVAQDGDAIKITFTTGQSPSGAYQQLRQTKGLTTDLTVGKWYKVTGQAKVNSGSANALIVTASNWTSAAITSTSFTDFTIYFLCDNANTNYIAASNLSTGEEIWFRALSVRELAGNHATAPTDAARPIYGVEPKGGRRNLLTWTEDFRTTAQAGETRPWLVDGTTITADFGTAPDGTVTADRMVTGAGGNTLKLLHQSLSLASGTHTFSMHVKDNGGTARVVDMFFATPTISAFAGASYNFDTDVLTNLAASAPFTLVSSSRASVGSGWFRITIAVTVASAQTVRLYTGANYAAAQAGNFLIWGAQLELGSIATAYQRVTTDYDVTEAGVATCHYCRYDGSDDSLSTAAIDFTATDKMSVFAGVRKLSDAATGVLMELGSSTDNGSFLVHAPNTLFGLQYRWALRNNAGVGTDIGPSTGYAAPINNVLTGIADISGDRSTIRLNGTQVAQSTADQGTGNFANLSLNIGRRAGGSLSFNGKDYGIIVVGKAASAGEITNTELWLSDKTSEVDVAKSISPNIYTRSGDTILDRANSIIERRTV